MPPALRIEGLCLVLHCNVAIFNPLLTPHKTLFNWLYWLSETFWKDFSILWGIQYNLFILANMKSIYRVFQKNFTIHMTVQARQIFSTHCSSYFPWQQTLKSFPILFCFSLSRHPCFTCFSLFYRQSVNIGDSTKSLGIWKLEYL